MLRGGGKEKESAPRSRKGGSSSGKRCRERFNVAMVSKSSGKANDSRAQGERSALLLQVKRGDQGPALTKKIDE